MENGKPDTSLTKCVVQSFRHGVPQIGNSIWLNEFAKDKQACVETLMNGEIAAAEALLTDPASSMLFYGFDNIHANGVAQIRLHGGETG